MSEEKEMWVICAGITARHETRFIDLFMSQQDAQNFANRLIAARYPNTVLKTQKRLTEEDGINYLHPEGGEGNNVFIELFPYDNRRGSQAVKHFKDIARLDAEEEEYKRKNAPTSPK